MKILGDVNLPLPESPQAKFWTWVVGVVVGTVAVIGFADYRWMARAEAQEKMEAERKERSDQIAQLNSTRRNGRRSMRCDFRSSMLAINRPNGRLTISSFSSNRYHCNNFARKIGR